MKRHIQVEIPGGKWVEAFIQEQDENVEVHIDGKTFQFPRSELGEGDSLFSGGRLLVSLPSMQRSFSWKPFVPGAKNDTDGGSEKLQALFPGKVIKVLAKAKTSLKKGDLAVIMESMKMEYSYRAPKNVTIEKVLVKEGDVLAKGQPFFQMKK